MGKTDTIKKRAVYLYLPSIESKRRWVERADKQGISLSKFVYEHVENSLLQEEDSDYISRKDLFNENKSLRESLSELSREKRVLSLANDRLERELRRYRSMPFVDNEFVGVRTYQKELVELLKEGGSFTSAEILSRLGIEVTEQDTVKSISKQLENLEDYGLLSSSSLGWRWKE
jgi:hypothetical protein